MKRFMPEIVAFAAAVLIALFAPPAFAQVKISELPASAQVEADTEIPAVQLGTTVKITPGLPWTFGYPAAAGVSTVTLQNTNPIFELRKSDAAANGGRWRWLVINGALQMGLCADDGTTCTVWGQVNRSGSTLSSITLQAPTLNLAGTTAQSGGSGVTIGSPTGGAQGAGSINAQALYVNGAPVPSGVAITTGTFTATWETACTTNPTQNWKWIKVGSLVTLTALQGFTCTSDSTTFTASFALPAAIRPDASQRVIGLAVTDNGVPDVPIACLHVEPDGSMSVRRSSTAPCQGNTFTNSGTKGFTIQSDPSGGTPQGPQTFTYDTDVVP
jgi:hypothetical protein